MNAEDTATYIEILHSLQKRAPAMMAGKLAGAQPSIEEAFFLGSLITQEEEKRGLSKHWFLKQGLIAMDEQEAKTLPYKCSMCGRRFATSDKRNACTHR